MSLDPSAKGTVPFGEHHTWYRVTGDLRSGRPALVVVHGGPGATHDSLVNLAALAEDGWPVVHYDQLGNGGSSHLPDRGADFWSVELFLDELDNLLKQLGVADDYVLFGHSWGGILSAKHAAGKPAGLRGLILADSPASYPQWRREMDALRAQLPPGVDEKLRKHEAAGTTDSQEYLEATMVFYARHVCRMDPWPREYMATFMEIYNDPTVYFTMNGPTEFHVTGTLRDFSVTDCAADIEVPTLLVSGRYDEATEAVVRPYHELIPDVRWEIFDASSHVPNLEEPERFREVMRDFLKELEQQRNG
ncbi:proline iminopeptidase-family hydrolase [Streptomyces boncukensis]|uniref:Proline iminopeptidase n=1 Tax=Streptomyces boncukensis TaxID=2711219 RepID=A0A6G4X4I9_9ACTN|nr:proline iminopeptidase-family hydrolase [Streptomyces boncukensis]NGO72308.1 proline iminopeptidase-family hydrolase [Streptomyces boncukensis]